MNPKRSPLSSFLVALFFGGALATSACAASSGDEDRAVSGAASVTTAAASIAIANTSVTATDSAITVEYGHSTAVGPFTVALNGPTGSYSQIETSFGAPTLTSGVFGAIFAGLPECAAFIFTVSSGATTLATGAIHTRAPGNVACATSETLAPAQVLQFRGVGHLYDGTNGLQYGTYPWGSAWNLGGPLPGNIISVGFDHFDSSNELFVDARRAKLTWNLDPAQLRRATDARFVATYEMDYGQPSCLEDIEDTTMVETIYPITTVQTDNVSVVGGQTWPKAMGTPTTSHALAPQTTGGRGIAFANGTASLDLGQPTSATVQAGLFGTGDGFGSQVNGASNAYFAHDNAQCMIDMRNLGLQLTYAALPPDSPLGCSVAIDCAQATITCNGAGDIFVVHQVTAAGDVAMPAVDLTSTPTQPFTQTVAQSGGASYYVCTTSGGATSCTSTLPVTSNLACCSATTTCTSTASPPTITVACPGASSFYLSDSFTNSSTSLGSGTSFTESTSTVTTQSVVACPNGVAAGSASCQSFSTYLPKSSWCGSAPPPPSPSCGRRPRTACSAGWTCCGTDGWECGLCQ